MSESRSVREAYAQTVLRLSRAGVASPESEAWQLLEAALSSTRSQLMTDPRSLSNEERRRLGDWLARRELREPLQLILGKAYFYGLEIPVNPGVLVPRPETERLVEITLNEVSDVSGPRILDVGTGSGVVALALKSERPDAVVAASEVDDRVLNRARENAAALGFEVEFHHSDLLSDPAVERFARTADAIVSNPPYLPATDQEQASPEVVWDPPDALYAGDDGLAVFRPLMLQAFELLRPGRLLVVELDPRNVDAAREEAVVWSDAEVHSDLAGRRRFLLLRR